ncbi:MAG: 4a-hydroxytetrahydrobiopterin dehydratase [Acidimicrobiia bacterium]|nr:4a-hydroxytetrahydrobiopterin dehydratase [Acidimicrobiia bacterium]
MPLASDAEINDFLSVHTAWTMETGELTTPVTLKNFNEAMGLVTRIALMAEKANHHPDIAISWNRVTLRISTHSEGGVTDKDLDLAGKLPLT